MSEDTRLVVIESTGESIDLSTDTKRLVRARVDAAAYREEFRDYLDAIDDELIARMDRAGRWTQRAEGFELSAPSPEAHTELDGRALYEALSTLVEDGDLDASRRDEAAYVEVKLRLPAGAWEALQAWPPLADGRVKVAGQVAWSASKGVAAQVAKTSSRAANLVDSARIAKPGRRALRVKEGS